MRKLLVRADDFGFSEGVNHGVAKTVREGIVRNVGLMPNMAAAEHGVSLLRDMPVCWGQHTNICVGPPLSNPEQVPSLLQANGEFKTADVYRSAEKDFVVLEEAVLEVEAQYQRFVELIGRKPQYFEGHAVASENFFRTLDIVAQRHGLRQVQFPLNGPVVFGDTRLHVVMESMQEPYDAYGALKRAALGDWDEEECGMLVCHPGYLDHYLLTHGLLLKPRAQEVDMLCDKAIRVWLEENDVRLMTYDEL